MPADELTVLLLIGLIALIAGFIHSAIGFGFGIVAVTLLPLVIDAKQAHVVVSTAGLPVLMTAAWAYRKGGDWSALWPALAGAALFLPLGLLAFEWVSIDWLVRGTGAAILIMVWMSFRNRRRLSGVSQVENEPIRSLRGRSFAAGGLGGFLAGAVSIAGPPVAAFALSQPWDQQQFKSFLNQFLVVVTTYKVIGLATRGFLHQEELVQAAALAPMAMIGIQVGVLASGKLSTRRFHLFVAIALIAVAAYFVLFGANE